MKKVLLTAAAALAFGAAATQAETVQQFLRVTDSTFHVDIWDGENNSFNGNTNSFTIGNSFGAVGWEFNGNWWDPGIDWSGYDKLVLRVKSVYGNNLQFRIFDQAGAAGERSEYCYPDDLVDYYTLGPDFDEELEYEVYLDEDLFTVDGSILDVTDIKRVVFWNYWSTTPMLDEDGNPVYQTDENGDIIYGEDGSPMTVADDDASVTVTISAFYLERTLANGEKDYFDLLSENIDDFWFSDEVIDEEGYEYSYIDNGGTLHMNENVFGGFFFEDPQDWSQYRYLVIVPKAPGADELPVVDYNLADYDDNVFSSGSFRHGVWNRPRACVLDLDEITTITLGDTSEENGDAEYLDEFNTKEVAQLYWSRWGGVSATEYGLAAAYLSNTCPTWSSGFGDGTDSYGDFVRDNASAEVISTICLPFAAAICGAEVYELVGTDDLENPTEIYAAPHMGVLEQGKPYILKTNCARNITAHRAGCNEIAEPEANGALKANSFATYYVEADKNYLVLNADGDTFEAVTDRATRVNSNTAYVDFNLLPLGEEVENGIIFNVSGVDPNNNGIEGIVNDNVVRGDDTIYNLMGIPVKDMSRPGIYIQNGKKFIVR